MGAVFLLKCSGLCLENAQRKKNDKIKSVANVAFLGETGLMAYVLFLIFPFKSFLKCGSVSSSLSLNRHHSRFRKM